MTKKEKNEILLNSKEKSKLSRWLDRFLRNPWASGVVLMFFVAVAMVLANLPATKEAYHAVLNTELKLIVGNLWNFKINIEKVINDGLMVIFFFVVGLEIKHEIKEGQQYHQQYNSRYVAPADDSAVEQCNHNNRTQVVGNGQRHEEHLERHGNPIAQNRHDGYGKGDVRGGGDAPADGKLGVVVEQRVNQSRCEHTAQGCHHGQ